MDRLPAPTRRVGEAGIVQVPIGQGRGRDKEGSWLAVPVLGLATGRHGLVPAHARTDECSLTPSGRAGQLCSYQRVLQVLTL